MSESMVYETVTASILNRMVDGVIVISTKGAIIEVNHPTQCMFGYQRSELIGQNISKLMTDEHRNSHNNYINAFLETGKTKMIGRGLEVIGKRKDGTTFHLEIGVSEVKNENQHLFVGTLRDITKQKKADAHLTRLGRILDDSWNEIYIFNIDSLRFVQVNQGAEHNLGYSSEELTQLTAVDIKPEFTLERFREMVEPLVAASTQQLTFETIHQRKNGSTYPVEIRLQISRSESDPVFVAIIQDITKRRQVENTLRASEQKLSLHIEQTPLAVIEWDTEFFVTEWNPAAENIFGYRQDEVIGRHAGFLLPAFGDDDKKITELVNKVWNELISNRGGQRSTNENVAKDGNRIVCEWYNTPLIDKDGHVTGVASLVQNITDRHNAEEQLHQEKERAEVTLQSIADAVITTNTDGIVQYLNPAAEELTGWRNSEAKGRPLINIFNIISELTRQAAENPVKQCLRDGTVVNLANHTVLIKRNGQEISIEDSAAPIHDRDGKIIGVVMVFHDCSNERQLKHQLSHQASHDSLTGLANRRKFELYLEELLTSAKKYNLTHALIYLDLDQFKVVNDTCGHVAGDELLSQISVVLKAEVRESDILARLGGDEFGILLEKSSLENAKSVAEKLRQAIRNFRFVWQDKTFEIGASIGLTDITIESEDSGSLLSAADVACYTAKEMGRNRIHVYTDGDADLAKRQGEMQWVSRIKQALDENRLCLYGQAIVPVIDNNNEASHYEILVRMIDEQGKLIPPGAFLPAAERYNLMPAIDRWVINNAFSDYANLGCSKTKLQPQLSINLSGTSLNDDDFLEYIHTQFKKHNVPPKNISFEITETVAVANLAKAIHFMNDLKSIGCRFSLDDFGSGISSFAYLKNLPVDYLKIDGNFIKDMVDDPIDRAMVESITKIGHVMGLKTIAEYVETKDILKELQKIGVDYAQGFGVGKPEPLSESCKFNFNQHNSVIKL